MNTQQNIFPPYVFLAISKTHMRIAGVSCTLPDIAPVLFECCEWCMGTLAMCIVQCAWWNVHGAMFKHSLIGNRTLRRNCAQYPYFETVQSVSEPTVQFL